MGGIGSRFAIFPFMTRYFEIEQNNTNEGQFGGQYIDNFIKTLMFHSVDVK